MDPVRFNLIVRALESIPSEMSINMLKAAYSSIVREAKDLSTALFDPDGDWNDMQSLHHMLPPFEPKD